MPETLTVPARFNGPLESGNGGYSAGALAAFIDGPVEVTLRTPVPLDVALDVVREDGSVRALEGDALVAEARPAPAFDLDPPAAVSVEQARDAVARYRGLFDGPFSRCFVCGRARDDAFGVFAGAVEGRRLVASPWTPPAWAAGEDGNVRAELVWAVLDCPTFFATYIDEVLRQAVLGRITARLDAPVRAGEEHVVVAWPIEVEGRKRHAGSAVLSAGGEPLAIAHALLIEPRQ